MLSATIKIQRNNSRSLSKSGKKNAANRNAQLATYTVVIMRQLVPVDSGDLKSTIVVVINNQSGSAAVSVGGQSKSGAFVNYHYFVNYGTIYSAAQPYIEPAIESVKRSTRNRTFTVTGRR